MWLRGTVKGFAYTLALGIVISMFTALVISRLIINALYAVGIPDEKFYGHLPKNVRFDFVGKRKIFFAYFHYPDPCGPVAMLIHAK